VGYNIRIGNAEPEFEWPDLAYADATPHASWTVPRLSSESAPYSSDSGNENQRDPSYTGWDEFTRKVGLHDWFYNKEFGKMRRHPGCYPLTKEDVVLLKSKLDAFKAANPSAEATWCECVHCAPYEKKGDRHNPNANGDLVRLTWLVWWVEYAVANCERPAIENG
jgi:hypothetical protein